MKVGGRPAGPLNILLLGFLVLTQKTKVSVLHTNFCGIISVISILKCVDDREKTKFAMEKAYSIEIQIKVFYE